MADPTQEEFRTWHVPGCYNVAPGVHRIPLQIPDVLRAINVYAVEDGDGVVLIDSGWDLGPTRDELAEGLKQIGFGLTDIRRFVVTHFHRDHYTLGVRLRREFGIPLALGRGEGPSLEVAHSGRERPYTTQLTTLRGHGGAAVAASVADLLTEEFLDPAIWEDPDEWVEDGAVIALQNRTLRAIHTPGHTQGHLVLHDPAAGLLFSGDHILRHITPSIGFEPAPGQAVLEDYLRSLRAVRTLPDAQLLPAHGPVGASVHSRVDELLAHHDARLAATADAVAMGATTAHDVAQLLTWTRHDWHFADLKPFHQMLAVIETLAHLVYLVDRGEMRMDEREATTHFLAEERV